MMPEFGQTPVYVHRRPVLPSPVPYYPFDQLPGNQLCAYKVVTGIKPSPRQAAGSLHRKEKNRFSVPSLSRFTEVPVRCRGVYVQDLWS